MMIIRDNWERNARLVSFYLVDIWYPHVCKYQVHFKLQNVRAYKDSRDNTK